MYRNINSSMHGALLNGKDIWQWIPITKSFYFHKNRTRSLCGIAERGTVAKSAWSMKL